MEPKITVDYRQFLTNMTIVESQLPFAMALAATRTGQKAIPVVQAAMRSTFDRPTVWSINSLRLKSATKAKPVAVIAFKDKNSVESSRTMIEPHVAGTERHYKAMEVRLLRMGVLPKGWRVVPGAGAQLDSYGNMSAGQISQVLNVLGAYTEAGFNKANINTVKRLAKGNAKKNVYGFVYWVNPVGSKKGGHLQPGVYQRISTAFGSSLKPIMIFVRSVSYKPTLDFYGKVNGVVAAELPGEFVQAYEQALRTALPKTTGGQS